MCKALEDMRNDALAEGKAQSVLELLTYLPGMISESLRTSILGERDSDTLSNYLRLAATSSSVEEFSSQLS